MTEHYVAVSTVAALIGVILITFFFRSHATRTRVNPAINHSGGSRGVKREDHSQQADVSVAKESDFPSDWFTSSEIFNLETRAIFCKVCLISCSIRNRRILILETYKTSPGSSSRIRRASRNQATITRFPCQTMPFS